MKWSNLSDTRIPEVNCDRFALRDDRMVARGYIAQAFDVLAGRCPSADESDVKKAQNIIANLPANRRRSA